MRAYYPPHRGGVSAVALAKAETEGPERVSAEVNSLRSPPSPSLRYGTSPEGKIDAPSSRRPLA